MEHQMTGSSRARWSRPARGAWIEIHVIPVTTLKFSGKHKRPGLLMQPGALVIKEKRDRSRSAERTNLEAQAAVAQRVESTMKDQNHALRACAHPIRG